MKGVEKLMDTKLLLEKLHKGDRRALARLISIVENDGDGSLDVLSHLKINSQIPVIGITGPPGAGKSTLVSSLTSFLSKHKPGCKIAILAVDPTSPFTMGSLLGDRLRMTEHFNNPDVFIRSLATRGSLGGLSAKTIEIADVLKAAGFEYIIIETVGVGQSEVEIASLAETTVVAFVPESGDEIQTIKSGIMEIADIFVVNKSDREGSDRMVRSITATLHERTSGGWQVPVIKTIATSGQGINELAAAITSHHGFSKTDHFHQELLVNKATRLAQSFLFKKHATENFRAAVLEASTKEGFNIYSFISDWFSKS